MSTFLVCAGGTGGHLFPAEALAHELRSRGHAVHLATDERANRFAGEFPADAIHVVPSATIGSKNPVALLRTVMTLWKGMKAARVVLREVRPAAVIGFGGYPTLPPMIAAAGVFPTMVHEQNAVMGRANKLLAGRVDAIAGGFLAIDGPHAAKMERAGNPVRPAVIEAARAPYAPSGPGEPFHLVVFGGSQGAAYFSQVIPDAIGRLGEGERVRLRVTQQARQEDEAALVERFRSLGVAAEVASFFGDLPTRMAAAQLVVSRSGASTTAEVATIGRPAILVPYPHALDHDQAANAAALQAEGGATLVTQSDLTAERLAAMLTEAMAEPDRLARMAEAGRRVGHADAAKRLADMAERIAKEPDA